MIVLSVISYNGAAVNNIPPVSFDELGGTIGRADTNQLVLPDAERTISRVHAQLVFRAGHYALVDRGSNAVLHNGQPIGNGREVLLVVGDDIQIGGYLISVSNGAAPKANDPFADFDGDAGVVGGRAPPAPSAQPPVRAAKGDITASPAQRPAPPPPSPPRAAPVPAPRAAPPVASAPAARPQAAGIPDDWDPFRPDPPAPAANLGASAPRPPAGRHPNPLMDDLPVAQPSSEQSLDALFGLSGGAPSGDPLAGSSLLGEHQVAQPNTAASGDPMQALLQSAKPGGASDHDHASDMQAPWHQGRAVPAHAPIPAPPPFNPTATTPLSGAVLSWDQPAQVAPAAKPAPQMLIPESATIIARPPGRAPVPAPPPTPVAAQPVAPAAPQPPAVPAPAPRAAPDLTTPVPAPFSASADSQQLMLAFLQGLGASELRMAPLTPEAMRQLGELVREAAKGTVELLAARTALKKEVRAEVTVMVPNRNNALKFSPTVEFALQYLLGPPTAGFMGPVDSMRDAYDSLRAHQLGVMAGMRGALAEAVKRFDPAQLEKKLGAGAGGGLLPSSRKAKLWELFQEQFGQLSHEVEEDFDELFGKAFERYVAELNASKKN